MSDEPAQVKKEDDELKIEPDPTFDEDPSGINVRPIDDVREEYEPHHYELARGSDDENENQEHEYQEYQEYQQEDESLPDDGREQSFEIQGEHEEDLPLITYNIFVGDLHSKVTDEELRTAFEPCGEIHSVNVLRDKQTGDGVGYGFVHFLSKEAQQTALKPPYSTLIFCGQPCRVNSSDGKNTLFVGNLSPELNEDQVREELEKLVGRTVSVELKKGPPPEYESRGFAFVTFGKLQNSMLMISGDRQTAETAKRILLQRTIPNHILLNVKWAEVRREITAETMANVTTLYIANVHKCCTPQALQMYFEQWGNVKNSVIVKNQHGAPKGFGFVTYEHRVDCLQALNYSNNQLFCGQTLVVTLAKPYSENQPPKRTGIKGKLGVLARGRPMTNGARSGGKFAPRGRGIIPGRGGRGAGGQMRGGVHPRGGFSPRGGMTSGMSGRSDSMHAPAQRGGFNQPQVGLGQLGFGAPVGFGTQSWNQNYGYPAQGYNPTGGYAQLPGQTYTQPTYVQTPYVQQNYTQPLQYPVTTAYQGYTAATGYQNPTPQVPGQAQAYLGQWGQW